MLLLKEKIEAFFNRPSKKDFYELFTQLRFQLSAGLSFVQACQEVGPLQPNKYIKRACAGMTKDLITGFSVSDAFKRAEIFPAEISETLSAGEKSGEMVKVFEMLASKMKLEAKLYGKVNSALLTPKIAACLMLLLVTAFSKVIMPQYVKLYEESQLEMPAVLKAFLTISNGIFDHWYLVIPLVYGLVKFWQWFTRTHFYWIDTVRLKLPIYSKLHFAMLQHQFCSNLAIMIDAGLLLPEACKRLADIVDSNVMSGSITKANKAIVAGVPLSTAFKKNNDFGVFDASLLSFIGTGYQSGQLADAMHLSSELYEMKLQDLVETVPTKLTVVVIAPMGVLIVGLYLLSLMPMLSYFNQISGG
jgi:type IV pilus assembly protein PilC